MTTKVELLAFAVITKAHFAKEQIRMAVILGPSEPAGDFLEVIAKSFQIRRGAIMVAWARVAGVGLLHRALGTALKTVEVVVGMSGGATSAEALGHLFGLCAKLYVFHKHPRQTFHPKLYWFDDGESPPQNAGVLVGSSNLTGGGLFSNFEANVALCLHPASDVQDRKVFESAVASVSKIVGTSFCEEIVDLDRIKGLIEDGYINTEAVLLKKQAQEAGTFAKRKRHRRMPEAPPPHLPGFNLPSLRVSFVADAQASKTLPSLVELEPAEQFYVRTLTQNDINKLYGRTPGTAEWDIGETARDAMPQFWGWKDMYKTVIHKNARLEWSTRGTLRSSRTGDRGIQVEAMLWYREPRTGHAAEHRLRIGPKSALRAAVPQGFNTSSIVVIQRQSPVGEYTFSIRMLTKGEPGFEDYVSYLRVQRPQHRYGYGPDPASD